MRTKSLFFAAFLALSASAWASADGHDKPCCPEIRVDKISAHGEADQGNLVDYTIRVFNASRCEARDLRVEDLLPKGLFDLSPDKIAVTAKDAMSKRDTGDCSINAEKHSFTCTNVDIEPGSVFQIKFTGRVLQSSRPGFKLNHVCAITKDGVHVCDDAGIFVRSSSPDRE
jgi:uncharacterized repeat protein (TIGR01451 family)